jgi:hypothetical protein
MMRRRIGSAANIVWERKAAAAHLRGGAVVVPVGILAQSGGFFLHMAIGQPGEPSVGTSITILGAVLLAAAIVLLVYGLITTPR